VVVIDETGAIEVFNKAAERIFGYTAAEIAGRNVSELMPSPYRQEHDHYIATYLETRKPKIIGIGREVEARRKDGTVFPAELSVGEAAPVAGGHRFVGIIRDITERRRLEEEARQDRERLAHVTRLTMMGEMATGIAHEINQPLTAIASYAQACIRLLGDEDARHDDEVQDALEQISRQAMRAGEVIRRLRTFVRKGENKRTPHDLNALVSEVERLAEVDAKLHGAKLRLELGESLPGVLVDGVQIQQVLLNLIRNGLEAMEEAGVTDEPVIVRTERNGNEIEVSVIDSGVGLKPEDEDSLFNPFHTTKKTGMGMGLSISRSIIMSHGGRMWFTRNAERGTTFHFSLPIMRRDEDDDGGADG
jgi:two-component system sensor kinase FixL